MWFSFPSPFPRVLLFRCLLRVLDSFGTQAEFNSKPLYTQMRTKLGALVVLVFVYFMCVVRSSQIINSTLFRRKEESVGKPHVEPQAILHVLPALR